MLPLWKNRCKVDLADLCLLQFVLVAQILGELRHDDFEKMSLVPTPREFLSELQPHPFELFSERRAGERY